MTTSDFPRTNARPETEIFADLRSLCTSRGYIHAVAYFCWRDNLIRYGGPQVVAKDLQHQHSQDRLLRTEISTLIGLMVQWPAPGFEDTELGVFTEPEVSHGETEVYPRVQA
jgi:hypothetical protein